MQEHILKITSDKRIIGIGSGSTVTSIIKFLPRENKKYAASSITTSVLLTESGFDVIPLHSVSHLDVYIDGTDFYDSSNNLLKGGGGCILNERICMYMSKETHIIAQKTKFKKDFTCCTVVFEVMEHCIGVFNAFCVSKNIKAIMRHNFSRFGLYTTENGNYLFDVDYNDFLETDFCCIPGVFCHGFFNRNDYKYKIYEID